jgi:hypothetical protein
MFLQNLYYFFGVMEGTLIGGHGDNDQQQQDHIKALAQ